MPYRVGCMCVAVLALASLRATHSRAADAPPAAVAPFSADEARELQEAWAAHLKTPAMAEDQLGIRLALIPAGEFTMGSPAGLKRHNGWMADAETEHLVRITRPFYLSVHEVSRAAFRVFVEETGYESDAEKGSEGDWGMNPATGKFESGLGCTWRDPRFEQTDEHPVVSVSWHDATAFCRWLSRKEKATYRLPTEAEWEYACRAGTEGQFAFGDSLSSAQANCNGEQGYNGAEAGPNHLGTVPRGTFAANAFGLFDLHGNAWEWCADWYAPYAGEGADDPTGPSEGALRIMRGGGWHNSAYWLRSALRLRFTPTSRSNNVGFRVLREMKP
jgi:formylglycine-generating enzyme required for sulfatase activity